VSKTSIVVTYAFFIGSFVPGLFGKPITFCGNFAVSNYKDY